MTEEGLNSQHLLGEDASIRSENGKQFRRSDGLREAVFYDHPVYFQKSGKWLPIDNTLQWNEKESIYQNTASAMDARLCGTTGTGKLASLTYQEKTLSWEIEGLNESKGEVQEEKPEEDHDLALICPKELYSSIRYPEALSGADIIYELDSVLLREKIVLHSAEESRENYRYTLYWDGEIQENEKGLLFVSGEERIFRLYRPSFVDAAGEEHLPKTELIKRSSESYEYTVTVPVAWLKEERRKYPVVLDPSVGVPFKDYIVDYHISDTGTVKDRDSLMVGSGNKYRSVIKPDLSTVTFPADCFLEEADLVLSRYVYSGTAGDTYSFGGWLKSNGTPGKGLHDNTAAWYLNGIKELEVTLLNGSTAKGTKAILFGADTSDWQYGCASVTATAAYTRIRIRMTFSCISNDAYFDGIQLYRETFEKGYAYDTNGNVTGSSSLIGQNHSFTYSSANDVTQATDARGYGKTFTYDSKHNLTERRSAENVRYLYTRNSRGQVIHTEKTNSTESIYAHTYQTYDPGTGLLLGITDTRGKETAFAYDSGTRQRTTVIDPKGSVSTYTYGNAASLRRLQSLSSDGTGTVFYGYDSYGKLTEVISGNTVYGLTYNSWRRPLETKVGSTALSTNSYDTHHRLSEVIYANGYAEQYTYDSLDRVKEVWIRETAQGSYILAYEYSYDNEGELYSIRDYERNREQYFGYDHGGRLTEETIQTIQGTEQRKTRYEYDAESNVTKRTDTVSGVSRNTVYTYDKDSRPKTAVFPDGTAVTVNYDTIGRVKNRILGLSTDYELRNLYVLGPDTNRTPYLSSVYNGSDARYKYRYDDNGNIMRIWRGYETTDLDIQTDYGYDSANQLIREDRYLGANDPDNQTITYSYDPWGNLTEKRIYAYTTAADPGTPIQTIPYGYTSNAWNDQLTSYNNQSITYDAMGNPVSYLGKTLSWRGKQLTGAAYGAHTISYAYGADGMRYRKTVDGTDTEYRYSGSLLTGLTRGNDGLEFHYDGTGTVLGVTYNGTE